jgi:hypothetical protein
MKRTPKQAAARRSIIPPQSALARPQYLDLIEHFRAETLVERKFLEMGRGGYADPECDEAAVRAGIRLAESAGKLYDDALAAVETVNRHRDRGAA